MYTKALFTAFCCAMLLSPAVSFGAEEAAKAIVDALNKRHLI